MRRVKWHVLLALCLMCLMLLPSMANAAVVIDTSRETCLTINYVSDNTPMSGIHIDLYKVADVSAVGSWTLTRDFSGYSVSLDNHSADEWRALAQTLATYAKCDSIPPFDGGETDSNGALTFPYKQSSMKCGLYLAVARKTRIGSYTYTSEPFLIQLPDLSDGDVWLYDVNCNAKYTAEYTPDGDKTSTYVERTALKVWHGDDQALRPTDITVRLLRDGTVHDSVTLNKDNNWRYTWQQLPEYNDDGTLIDWQLTEETPEKYTVLIAQEGTTFVITNTYSPDEPIDDTVTRSVIKVWNDKNYESKRPGSVTVTLKRNGENYDTQVLSETNSWQYEWDDLAKADADGNEYAWTLAEKSITGYTASIALKGNTFVVTNSYSGKLPQTGVLWWPVPLLTVGGLLLVILGLLLGKRREHE